MYAIRSYYAFKLGQKNQIMDVLFAGNLQKETLDNILEKNDILKGQIKGDFYARILLDQPSNSTLQGGLTVKELIFPRKIKPPFVIHDLSLAIKKDILRVKSAKFVITSYSIHYTKLYEVLPGKSHYKVELMKSAKKKIIILMVSLALILETGCAPTLVSISTPEIP